MNYERMWSKLKAGLTKESDNVNLDQEAIEQYKQTLIFMNKIEVEEYEEECMLDAEYIRADAITATEIAKEKRALSEVLEQITGKKVIDNLVDLKKVLSSKKRMLNKTSVEKIFVDSSLDIPKEILREAAIHNIRIIYVGFDIIQNNNISKGGYIQRELLNILCGVR